LNNPTQVINDKSLIFGGRGTHRSTRQLEQAIRQYLELNNALFPLVVEINHGLLVVLSAGRRRGGRLRRVME
jgi:hypothetical protein